MTQPPEQELEEAVTKALARVGADTNTLTRARSANQIAELLRVINANVATLRREALRQLLAEGMTQADIKHALGMTHQRVSQVVGSRPRRRPKTQGTTDT